MRHVLIFLMLIALFLCIGVSPSNASEKYIVNVENSLVVRSGASTQYEKIGVLYSGQTVEVESFSGEWGQFNYNGTTGFIHSKYLSKVEKSPSESTIKKDFETSSMIAMYGIIVLSIILAIYRSLSLEDSLNSVGLSIYTTTYFILCFTELFLAYIIFFDYDIYTFDWIKNLDNLLLTIIVSAIGFCLFIYIIFNQVMSFISLCNELQDQSRYVNWKFGVVSTFLFIIGYAIYYLTEWEILETYSIYIIALYVFIQIIQLVTILYQMNGYVLHGIVLYILMLIAPLSLCLMFIPFLFVFIPLLIFIITALGYGRGSRSSSSQNAEYYQGYNPNEDLYIESPDSDYYRDYANGWRYKYEGNGRYRKM